MTHVTHSPYMTRMTRARVTVIMGGCVTCVTSCFSLQGRAAERRAGAADLVVREGGRRFRQYEGITLRSGDDDD